MIMEKLKERLSLEENYLKNNIEKLYDFTQSEDFEKIEEIQQQLLRIQLEAMRTYWRCLITRINSLK